MEKSIISFENAKKLKELGFDEVCDYMYTEDGTLVKRSYKNSDDGCFSDLGTSDSYAAPYATGTIEEIYDKWNSRNYKGLCISLFSKIYDICSYLGVKTADTNEPGKMLEKSEEMVKNIKDQYESPQPLDDLLGIIKNETDKDSIIWRLVGIIKDLRATK